jgi:medium-chain acyl-[acyl-carrier-protein] hydrolase
LALYLQNTGQTMPLHVFASDYSALCSPWPDTRTRPRNMHLLADAGLVEQLQKLNGTPQEISNDRDLLPIYLPTLRADFEILDTWTPGLDAQLNSRLNTPITAFGGSDDVVSFPKAQIKAWGNHTTSQFSFYMLQGDHFFIRSSEALLRQIMLDKPGLSDDAL